MLTLTGFAPWRFSCALFALDRAIPVTSAPASTSSGTRRRPITPVAPATKIRIPSLASAPAALALDPSGSGLGVPAFSLATQRSSATRSRRISQPADVGDVRGVGGLFIVTRRVRVPHRAVAAERVFPGFGHALLAISRGTPAVRLVFAYLERVADAIALVCVRHFVS